MMNSKSPDRPNILFFFTDQHRLSALGCYGETPCLTPNLDRLADQGVLFETAYTCCPVCSPARASIMTGRHIHAHGVTSNVGNLGCNVPELPDSGQLLSRKLQAAGYRCGYTGKWHLGTGEKEHFGMRLDPALPETRGFEGQNFPGHGGGGFKYPEYRAYLQQNGLRHEIDPSSGCLIGPTESTVPYFLAEHTIRLIDRFKEKNEPFFIWHNNWGPHGPYLAPREHFELYEDRDIPPWPSYSFPAGAVNRPHRVKLQPGAEHLEWSYWANRIRHYYAFTTLIDEQIGRILDHLEHTGLSENTIIIFTSDHGETCGSHGGLTDKGWQHFEEIQRVGMIFRLPSHVVPETLQSGRRESKWVSLVDIYPTILDFAGVDCAEERLHGRSLAPVLRQKEIAWRDSVFVQFLGVNNLVGTLLTCRHDNLKYGWNCSNLDELYDLDRDPHELNNLIDDPLHARAAEDMRWRVWSFMIQTEHPGRLMYARSRLGTSGDILPPDRVPVRI